MTILRIRYRTRLLRSAKAIVALTVRDILEEQIALKLA